MQSYQHNEKKDSAITTKKLLEAIFTLNQEQQSQVLNYVDELISEKNLAAENKRKSARKLCDISINYAAINRIFTDKITDISINGLFIETKRSLMIGEDIPLSFKLPGYDRPFKFRGQIVRSNQQGYGVEFKDIKPYIAQMFSALIERIKG